MTQGIYKITNTLKPNHYYVGSSVDVEERLSTHRWALRNNRHENPKLQRAWNKYGEDNFSLLLEKVFAGTYRELLEEEDKWLEQLPPTAYNIRKSSFKKNPYDENTRQKISAGVKRQWRNNRKIMMVGVEKRNSDPAYIERMTEGCQKSWDNDTDRRKNASEVKLGVGNPSADKSRYTFAHIDGETFTGFKCDFRRLHPELNYTGLKKIIDREWKKYKGWTVTLETVV